MAAAAVEGCAEEETTVAATTAGSAPLPVTTVASAEIVFSGRNIEFRLKTLCCAGSRG